MQPDSAAARAARPAVSMAVLGALALGLAGTAAPEALRAQGLRASPVDTTGLAAGEHAGMHTLFEVTIFQIDVLTLDVRFGPATAARLDSLVAGRELSDALADSVAAVALEAEDAWVRFEFLRDTDRSRFLDGIRDNLGKAREAGIVTDETYETVVSSLPDWYGFLEERGIREGDEMFYRIRGDTLRTVYRSADGEILLDQTDVGPGRGRSVLGGYFAPDSDFREGLIESLFEEED